MPSIKDVAKLAGVSIATVSRAINFPERVKGETRTKVNAAILNAGYSPNALARNFRRGRTNIILVVITNVGDPFFTDVVKGIHTVARLQNYSLLLMDTQANRLGAGEISQMLVSKQVDGIILLASTHPFSKDAPPKRGGRPLPIVVACESVTPELVDMPSVHIDNIAAAKEATAYLISLGHKKIACIYGSDDSLLTIDRQAGYRSAMHGARLRIEEGWVVEGKMTIDGAIKATRSLIHHRLSPTAIFCVNDEMAIAAMHELKSSGIVVPDQVSVFGFDDTRYSAVVDPPLTTISQPAEEIGERAMYLLSKAIDEQRDFKGVSEIVPHKLIIRRSVAAPPK
jgi:LacI family repressor for deo operon, udp, cdd, tsx, nupC, and nupG